MDEVESPEENERVGGQIDGEERKEVDELVEVDESPQRLH